MEGALSVNMLKRRPYTFFMLLVLYSIPIEYIAFVLQNPNMIPKSVSMTLRIVSLIVCCPALAALTLILFEEGLPGVGPWLMTMFDFKKIRPLIWLVPTLFVSLFVATGAYVLINIFGTPITNPRIDLVSVMISFVVLLPFAAAEELGWSAYAMEPLQLRLGALGASAVVGIVWSLWHIVPRLVGPHTMHTLIWAGINTMELRIVMAWVFFNGGRSVLAMILLHALDNVCYSNFPNFGSHWDPFYLCIMLTLICAFIIIFWDAKTMTKFRFDRAAPARLSPSA
jgi:hypothetical protein